MIKLLKKACDLHGQRKVGEMIGKSATAVNLILKGTYPKPEKILQKVDEIFTDLKTSKSECPVLGNIHINVCSKYKKWAKQGRVHKDRLYMQVKEHCKDCKGVNNE